MQLFNGDRPIVQCVQTLQVTRTDMMRPSVSSFLSEVKNFFCKSFDFCRKKVGGSVGLWLGLGVLQAAEILTNFLVAKILALRCAKEISDGDQVHVEK